MDNLGVSSFFKFLIRQVPYKVPRKEEKGTKKKKTPGLSVQG
jgi:hypothetical protein